MVVVRKRTISVREQAKIETALEMEERNAALLDYLSMMTGYEMPEEEEGFGNE